MDNNINNTVFTMGQHWFGTLDFLTDSAGKLQLLKDRVFLGTPT
jgi:hypothetical protein